MSTIKQILNRIKSNEIMQSKEIHIEDSEYFIYEYFNWLESFIEIYHAFSTDRWLAIPTNIKKNCKINITKIAQIYEIINEYAHENNIFSTPFDFGYYYNIKYFDKYYKIGIIFEDHAVTFCSESNEEIDNIDISDIINYYQVKEKNEKSLVLTKKEH